VHEGEIYRGDVAAFTEYLGDAASAGVPGPAMLYAPTDTGALVPVRYKVSVGGFDADDWGSATVSVYLAEGVTATSSYRVDGRG
jgi:hypothetical protein